MASPSDQEQLLLELVNHTRLDPVGTAKLYTSSYSPLRSGDAGIQSALSYYGVSGTALKAAMQALTPAQPLAWNSQLNDVATAHSDRMIAADEQSHQLTGEAALATRVGKTGYSLQWLGENIYAYSESMLYAHAGFMVDWGPGPDGMQSPAGHRLNIMNSMFREIGLGVVQDLDPGSRVGPWVVTQDFGLRQDSPPVFLLGVSYADRDGNGLYSVGEGRSGMSVSATGVVGHTTRSGGYVVELPAGEARIVFSGGDLRSRLEVVANLDDGTNAKLDVRGESTVLTSVSLTVVSGVAEAWALGVGNLLLTGTQGGQKLVGNAGKNVLQGMSGNDTLDGGAGADRLFGGSGNDIYCVDNAGDRIYETTAATGTRDAGGTDTVRSAISFDVAAYDGVSFVEKLKLTGTAAISGSGNSLANTLGGNSGANVLKGAEGNDVLIGASGADRLYGGADNDLLRGGAGNDVLYGGAGNDLFRFDSKLSTSTVKNVDRIEDFNPIQDTIQLENSIFTKFGAGTIGAIKSTYYRSNTTGAAQDSNDYLIYESDTGKLFYDADGSGVGSSIQIALLQPSLALTYADYVLI